MYPFSEYRRHVCIYVCIKRWFTDATRIPQFVTLRIKKIDPVPYLALIVRHVIEDKFLRPPLPCLVHIQLFHLFILILDQLSNVS